MEPLAIRPSWFVRLIRSTPVLRGLIPVENPENFRAGSDYASSWPASPAFDVRRSMSAYGAFPWVVACCGAVSTDLSGIPIRVKVNGEVVQDHPVLDLLKAPSTRTSGVSLERQWVTDYLLNGWAPLLVLRGSRGLPVSLLRMHPARVRIKATPSGEPDLFIYDEQGSETAYRFDDVLCPRAPSWSATPSSVYGQGAIAALNEELTADLAAQRMTRKAASTGRPDAVFKPAKEAGVQRWGPAQVREIRDALSKMLRDTNGGVAVLNGIGELQTLGWSPRDLEYPELRKLTRETILATFGCPPTRVGLPTANFATAREQMRGYWEGLVGLSAMFAVEMTRLARMFGQEGVEVFYDFSRIDALQASRSDRLTRVQLHVFNGMTPSDAYLAEGFDELSAKLTITPVEVEEVPDVSAESREEARAMLEVLRSGGELTDEVWLELIASCEAIATSGEVRGLAWVAS